MQEPQPLTQSALPLCASCVTTAPQLSALLNSKRIQQNVMAFSDAMARVDFVSYKQTRDIPPEKSSLEQPTEPLAKHATNDSNSSVDTQVDRTPCFLCSTRQAIPLFISLVGEAKAVRKETAASMTKADRKTLKAEVKGQMKDIKREVKKAKKEWKGDKC